MLKHISKLPIYFGIYIELNDRPRYHMLQGILCAFCLNFD